MKRYALGFVQVFRKWWFYLIMALCAAVFPFFLAFALAVVLLIGLTFYYSKRLTASTKMGQTAQGSQDTMYVLRQSGANRMYQCGHLGPESFIISIYGEESKEIAQKQDCHECILKQMKDSIIRCALCGGPIYPGRGVALYHEVNSKKLRLDIATRYEDSYLGCLGWDCCPAGAFFAGHWTGKEFKPQFGGKVAAQVSFETGAVVISNTDQE